MRTGRRRGPGGGDGGAEGAAPVVGRGDRDAPGAHQGGGPFFAPAWLRKAMRQRFSDVQFGFEFPQHEHEAWMQDMLEHEFFTS